MATDKNGKTKLPKGISYRADKDLYMCRFMHQGESHTSYHKDLKSAKNGWQTQNTKRNTA